tara:strand:- start:890 stop:1246 length:357 start_codon:yes stop_codon:yes gene_type:complete
MTMHLVRGMTTTSTRKRKQNRKPGQAQAQAAHDAWLRKMGVHPSQLKHKEKSSGASVPNYSATSSGVKTSDVVVPIAGKRKANEYSGDYIVGLATMHKSNIVPVGKGNSAEDYAKMRR